MKTIYLDHSATTPTDPEVVQAMLPYFTELYGNASSIHHAGRDAYDAMVAARESVASLIGASSDEIYFTGGGTEADNLAIQGYAAHQANQKRGNHIITSKIEHHAVLHTCQFLEKHRGHRVTYCGVDGDGVIDLDELAASIADDTTLISVMLANNEVGTIEPLREIRRIVGDRPIAIHTDAVQALGEMDIDVNELGVDMMTFSAHKVYGPKGVGALYIRRGTRVGPIMHGGGHERRKRPGTENVPCIVGFGKACELLARDGAVVRERVARLRDRLVERVMGRVEDVVLNGHPTRRIPRNASLCFRGCEGEALLLHLDMAGICASSGSACTSQSLEPSHVLAAMGVPIEIAHGVLRLTLGKGTTEEDIDYTVDALASVVGKIRGISAALGV